jgi:hypothetical protein
MRGRQSARNAQPAAREADLNVVFTSGRDAHGAHTIGSAWLGHTRLLILALTCGPPAAVPPTVRI